MQLPKALRSSFTLTHTGCKKGIDTYLYLVGRGFHRLPGGRVDTTVQQDYYNKDVTIRYQAYKATQGKLKIKLVLY